MKYLLCLLALCVVVSSASADRVTKRIMFDPIIATGAADTTAGYPLPTGCSDLRLHVIAVGERFTFQIQCSINNAAWFTAIEVPYEGNAVQSPWIYCAHEIKFEWRWLLDMFTASPWVRTLKAA